MTPALPGPFHRMVSDDCSFHSRLAWVGVVKASATITVTAAVAALSLSLAACGGKNPPAVTADCTQRQPDGSHKVVADELCDRHAGGSAWIYGGSYHNGYVSGGSQARPPRTDISTRSGRTVVGGFGGSGRGGGS